MSILIVILFSENNTIANFLINKKEIEPWMEKLLSFQNNTIKKTYKKVINEFDCNIESIDKLLKEICYEEDIEKKDIDVVDLLDKFLYSDFIQKKEVKNQHFFNVEKVFTFATNWYYIDYKN